MTARFVVGIDLGTTNTVVAAVDLEDERALRRGAAPVFPIEQRVDAGTVDARALLPSALYAPSEAERRDGDPDWIVGAWARARGAEVPARSVTSSKSWLAHPAVDRTAEILPWGIEEEGAKISPVDAGARILAHVRDAWDRAHAEAPLVEQSIVLTVPASFDEAARALTIEATRRAGLPEGAVRLLEEPQAAFLDWARIVGDEGLRALLPKEGEHAAREILVCDVGGGTSDFSLLEIARDRSAPAGVAVKRVAVGDHLLLGGDNVDLAIAHLLEGRLAPEGERLSPSRFVQLVAAAREAKERMLARDDLAEVPVTLLGSGSRLVGGARTTTLDREELERLLDGFFPIVDRAARPARPRAGLVAFGLPYASDPAITRHLAQFLGRHARLEVEREIAVLLNGGAFHARPIVDRVGRAIEALTGRAPRLLVQGDPDLSVARGAVAYGLALRGHGLRIGGGAPRSYWIGLDVVDGARRAVCVVPRGAEPADRQVVEGRTFALTVGRAARFDLFASAGEVGRVDRVGDVTTIDEDTFALLPPVVTAVPGERGEVKVRLEGELTEIGTLDLECAELEGQGRRFRLGFELRKEAKPSARPPSMRPSLSSGDKRLDAAREKVERVFGKAQADVDPRAAKNLVRELEKILGERASWPTTIVRPLFDLVAQGRANRKRSADHERVFFWLVGWLLRPGFGDPLDPQRVRLIEPLFEQRLANANEGQSWRAWWIAWRRIAGGLSEPVQTKIRDVLDPFLVEGEDKPRKKPKGVRAEPIEEVLHLASALERVENRRKSELGAWLLEKTWTSRDPSLYAALGRLGARVPAYASAHHVLPPRTAESWLGHVLRVDFREIPTAPFAAVQLARKTGDRARDVSEAVREETAKRLEKHGARPEWIRMVREVVAVDADQRAEALGEALPPGLRLVD